MIALIMITAKEREREGEKEQSEGGNDEADGCRLSPKETRVREARSAFKSCLSEIYFKTMKNAYTLSSHFLAGREREKRERETHTHTVLSPRSSFRTVSSPTA